jgi:hypothetical protein
VEPGTKHGGVTAITVTCCDVVGVGGALQPLETFKLVRPRSDAS